MRWCTVVCLWLMGLARAASGVSEDAMLNQCSELKAQEHLDLNEVMGKWYVVEVIEHKSASRQGASGVGPSRIVIDACPIVKLRSIEMQPTRSGPPRISLLWDEDAGTLEYTFWVSSIPGPGVWNSDIAQNGTLAEKTSYKQFIGTVRVMKAVAAHLVLTFCTRDTEGQKFSVLLGREHKLPSTDLRGVHKLLERRNLHLLNIRESCANGAATSSYAQRAVIVLGLLAALCPPMLRKLIN